MVDRSDHIADAGSEKVRQRATVEFLVASRRIGASQRLSVKALPVSTMSHSTPFQLLLLIVVTSVRCGVGRMVRVAIVLAKVDSLVVSE
jgi:hypothetical protein